MNLIFKKTLFLSLLFFTTTVFADISEVDSITKLRHLFQYPDKEALYIFDMDDVLVTPKDNLFRYCDGKNPYIHMLDEYKKQNAQVSTPEQRKKYEETLSTWRLKRTLMPVENKMIEYVQLLQDAKINSIVLSQADVGKFGFIDSMEQWRLDDLAKFNYNFTTSFQNKTHFSMDNLPQKNCAFPSFASGVLLTSCYDKGSVLGAFLDKAKLTVKKVYFFDDRIKNLEDISVEMQKRNIQFFGYHYTAYRHLPCHIDEKVAAFQKQQLFNKGVWFDDKEALEALSSRKIMHRESL